MTGLPAPGTPWPPKPYDQVLDACQERHVWWEGDPDKLAAYYDGRNIAPASGIIPTLRKWFWGAQQTESTPKRLHVPVAADLGRVAASTLLSQPVTFSDPAGNKALQDRIDRILNTEDTYSRMLVAAEAASMLSGTYGRIVWDDQIRDHAWIDWVDADRAIPTFRWGVLTEVSFWTELPTTDSRTVYRWIQHYSRGRIDHALYEGSGDNLGQQIPLTEHPQTAGLADQLEDGTTISLGVDKLGAAYFPNHRPNPQWRNEPALRDLGRSDLTADVIHLLDAIDRTWSSWMNDLELGRGRIIVSEDMLRVKGPGKGAVFDLDRSVYSPIGQRIGKDSAAESVIEAHQFDIRVEEHNATFDTLLRRVISRAGYSPITFGLQDEVATTATEVDAKERDTNATRATKIRLWSGLNELATTLMAVDAAKFADGVAPSENLEVDWPSMRQQSDAQRATTVQLWEAAQAASIRTKVAYLHPDWDDQRIDEEVERIKDDSSAPISILGPTESSFAAQPSAADGNPGADDPMDEIADDEEARAAAEQ